MSTTPEEVAEAFGLEETPVFSPRYNIAPTQPAPVVVEGDAGRRFEMFRWGLIPSWAKDPAIANKLINARSETVAEKPSFRAAFKQRRCLMIADGFYEWQKGPKSKQPFHIRMKDGRPFAFAALWERWEGDGETVRTCCILTTTPNDLMRTIHDRMPVILEPRDFELWLDPKVNKAEKLLPLLVAHSEKAMTAFAVSTRVNSPSRDDSDCILPAV